MPKFTIAIWSCWLMLAAELQKDKDIRVDIYESLTKFDEIQSGANVTLWGRVAEALRSMGLSEDCNQASMTTASKTSASVRFRLRGTGQLDKDFGTLPFRSAWSLRRADLIRIFRRRISPSRIHLSKRLVRYSGGSTAGQQNPTRLEFADGTVAVCDALIAADGIRSAVRAQMMKGLADSTRNPDYLRHVESRWSGTVVYRTLIPSSFLADIFPNHPLLSGGQIYLGPHQHIIAQPVSDSLINLAVSVTFSPQDGSRWPYPAWSTKIDKKACKRKIGRHFANWDGEVRCVVDAIDNAVECAVMDIEPLPCYTKGCVALIGDAAHAAVPYLGANPALAIEDAFVLARILRDSRTTRGTLSLALAAYQHIRRPYGNKHLTDARLVLQEFEYRGPSSDDPTKATTSIRRIFDQVAAVGTSGPRPMLIKPLFGWMPSGRVAERHHFRFSSPLSSLGLFIMLCVTAPCIFAFVFDTHIL